MDPTSINLGTPTRKERRKEQTQNIILDAAEAMFSKHGLEVATMDQIAEHASLSKGSLYNYFESKDDLLIGFAARGYAKLTEMFERAITSNSPGLGQIRSLGWAFFNFTRQYPIYSTAIRMVKVPAAGEAPLSRNTLGFQKNLQRFVMVWTTAIQKGIEGGFIQSTLKAPVLASIIAMITSGAIDQWGQREPVFKMFNMTEEDVMTIIFDWIYKILE